MDGSARIVEIEPPGSLKTVEIRVRGTVQGVGFRPTVWRLAHENDLVGYVLNDSEGVLITTTGEQGHIARFLDCLEANPPPLASIDSLEIQALDEIMAFDGFDIADSVGGETRTNVTADAATCPECWAEMLDPQERRYRYPFTNCTHCGPRLSIVTGVPYDRASTTMAPFVMCEACAAEYRDPADRRFHAQPIACPACGPKLWIEDPSLADDAPLDAAIRQLKDGKILAIRGLGGFHLACDAMNESAVDRLRQRKRRFGKPFALMARNAAVVRRFASMSPVEAALLQGPAAPIVLLRADGPDRLPTGIAPGLATLGFMLPYTPLHKLILEHFDGPLVMTSGNTAHEPQVTDNAGARLKLAGIADLVLFHVPSIGLFFFKLIQIFALYGAKVPCGWRDRAGAAIAGLALSHTIGKAVWKGLFIRSAPFLRTPKMEDAPALLQGLVMAREELVLLCLSWTAMVAVGWVHHLATWEATLWCAVLLTQSLPYLAAVTVSVVAAFPARSGVPAALPAPARNQMLPELVQIGGD